MSVLGVQHLKLVLMGSSPDQVKPKTIKLVFVVSMLSTQHLGERAKMAGLESG